MRSSYPYSGSFALILVTDINFDCVSAVYRRVKINSVRHLVIMTSVDSSVLLVVIATTSDGVDDKTEYYFSLF